MDPIIINDTAQVDILSLEGRVLIVTSSGEENGIGAGIVRTLTSNGATVTINYVSDTCKRVAKEV